MSSKAEITATIKFRGVTIEGMTVAELKELRDVINQLVGKEVERVVEHHHHDLYPWRRLGDYTYTPTWTLTSGNTTSNLRLDLSQQLGANSTFFSDVTQSSNNVHYTISCNN